MIVPVLERMHQHNLSLILVAPWWLAKLWFAEILNLLKARHWQFPVHRFLLCQAEGKVIHLHPELWWLHACMLREPI